MLLCRSVALHACERTHGNRKGQAATADMGPPTVRWQSLGGRRDGDNITKEGARHICPQQSHCFLSYPGPLLPRRLPGTYIFPKPPTSGLVPAEGVQGAAGGIHAGSWP